MKTNKLGIKNPKKTAFLSAFFIFAIFLTFVFDIFNAKADSISFYPNICLGGWTNPQNAAKESDSQDVFNYNYSNSAIKEPNTTGQIFCGEFAGEIPKDTEITGLSLKLGLLITNQSPEKPELDILESDQPILILETDTNLETNTEIESAESIIEDSIQETKDTIPEKTEEEPKEEGSDADKIKELSEDVKIEDLEKISFNLIKKISNIFIKTATAQEAEEQNTQIQTEEISLINETIEKKEETITKDIQEIAEEKITEEINNAVINTEESKQEETDIKNETEKNNEDIIQEQKISETNLEETNFELSKPKEENIIKNSEDLIPLSTETNEKESSVIIDTDLLEISYTVDSIIWQKIGIINSNNWQSTDFVLPIKDFNSWQDLSKLQIRIDSLPSFDNDPTFYLENVELSISYKKIIDENSSEIQKNSEITTEKDNNEEILEIEEQSNEDSETDYENNEQEENTNNESSAQITLQQIPEEIIKRLYTKELKIDAEAEHYCSVKDFTVDISTIDSIKSHIELSKDESGEYEIEIGSLPTGIDVLFTKNKDYYYKIKDESFLEIEISKQNKNVIGSFSIPFIFTKKTFLNSSSTICQINIVNN